jgi:hypothetical protein
VNDRAARTGTRATTTTTSSQVRTSREKASTETDPGDSDTSGSVPDDNTGGSSASITPNGRRLPPGVTLETVPPSIEQAYIEGFLGECESIWSIAGADGVLYDADDPELRPFVVDDCTSLLDPDEAHWYETTDEARAAGREDALWTFDEEMYGRTLRTESGDKVWTSPLAAR